MPRAAHPDTMRSALPSPTRTAPPVMPHQFPTGGRYLTYTLFDATGIVYLLLGFVALRVVWALGSGEAAWNDMLIQLQNPSYVAFHLVGLVSVLFVGVRFFRLFPKAQPPRIGPLKPPPGPVITAGLYGAWIGATVLLSLVYAGGILG